jgi:hypothetical protein
MEGPDPGNSRLSFLSLIFHGKPRFNQIVVVFRGNSGIRFTILCVEKIVRLYGYM